MGMKILKSKVIWEDDGAANTLQLVYRESGGEEEILEEVNTHCTHDYDCCGQWYSSVSRIIKTKSPNLFIVLIANRQNI